MMKLLHVFKYDVSYFSKKPMLIITFIAVACLPILYSGFLIKGNWDPYAHLEDLPVAVVNLDQGAEYQDEPMMVGNDLVNELKENRTFDWKFVTMEDATRGMTNNNYYAAITIPTNFSENAASLASDNPKQAELVYESNSYYNFISGQISENAIKELRNNLSEKLTEAYSRSIFKQFESLSSGLNNASVGATDLNDGAGQLSEGIIKFQSNLSQLTSGADKLDSSAMKLQDGMSKISDGSTQVSNGATDLSSGAKQLLVASTQLEEGAGQALQGASSLAAGLNTSLTGIDQLTSSLQTAAEAAEQLESGLASSSSASKELSSSSAQVAAGLQQLMNSDTSLAAHSELQQLIAASQAVATGAAELSSGQQQLWAGSKQLNKGHAQLLSGSQQISQGQQQLLQGSSKLDVGQKQVHDGLVQYNSKFSELITGSDQLVEGTGQVKQGVMQLESGLGQLAEGAGSLASGAEQLNSGASQLSEGSDKLSDGSYQLAVKLKDAAEQTANLKADDKIIEMMSQPVIITANDDRQVKLYAAGIAPYFLSLALFAGALVFTTAFSSRESHVEGATGVRLFISKMLTFGIMSIAQSLIMITIIIYFLGLGVESIALFYLYTAIVGFAFMFLVQMLVTWFDKPGQFVALLLLIFQLVTSAGTFPFELLPNWAQAMNPWLPMTYSVRGYRAVISSGDYSDMWTQVGYLAIYIVISVGLTLLYFLKKHKGTPNDQLRPIQIQNG